MFLKSFFSALMLAVALFAGSGASAQEPTISQVYNAVQANRMSEAQAMMAQVLQAHPDSAKAHYVEAELLAKQGRYTSARTELDTAEHLQPQLGFAKPEAISELKRVIASGLNGYPTTANSARAPAASFPWGWILILALAALVLVVLLMRATARRMGGGPARVPGYGPIANPMSPYGGMPMSPYGPMGGGMGSGLLGGLASGAAMGAGLVAGEELMHHLTDHGNSGSVPGPALNDASMPPQQDNLGGQDFGIPDGSSWDDGGGSSWDDGGSMGGGDWN